MTGWRLTWSAPARMAGWEARLRGLARAWEVFAARARAVAAEEHRTAEEFRRSRQLEAERELASTSSDIDTMLRQVTRAAATDLGRLAAALAPGPAGADWSRLSFTGSGKPHAVRIGTVATVGERRVPMVLPVLDHAGWWLDGREAAQTLVRAITVRLIAALPPGRLRVDTYDPMLTGAAGVFAAAAENAPDLVAESLQELPQLHACLAELAQTVAHRAARMRETGVDSFDRLQERQTREPEPWRLVLLYNYPAGFDHSAQQQLLRLVDSAPGRGVTFLVDYDSMTEPQHDVDPDELCDRLRALSYADGNWLVAGLDGANVTPDPPPDERLCAAVAKAAGEAAARAALPTVGVDELLPPRSQWWQQVGRSLLAPIGVDDRGPVTLELSTSDPAKPNVMIGGSVGSGKSNLLQVLIHLLAARYSPRDLRMYLLDFKQGIEFSALGPGPGRPYFLPHVHVLGVYSDREFGLAVLRHLARELERRSTDFKRWDCTDIAKPPPGMPVPPRLLVVLDEFQVMLADDDETSAEAAAALEHLVRQGRAYGLHIVLATQSLDGIARLSAKRDAILGQIHHRVVLKTTSTESQSMLRIHNTAASRLRFRGQAVLNDELGEPDSNRVVQVALADRPALDALRRQLWQMERSPRPPRVFEQGQPAELGPVLASAPRPALAPDGSSRGWVGMPITVSQDPEQVPVLAEAGAGLLILGEDEAMALGSLTAMAIPLAAAGRERDDSFIFFDFVSGCGEARDALLAVLRGLGVRVELVPRNEFGRRIAAVRAQLQNRSDDDAPVHLLGVGLHRAARFEADDLRQLVREGPANQVFLYGWWNRLGVCTSQLGYDRGGVNHYLFLRHPLDGVREVCGFVSWQPSPNRALYFSGVAAEPTALATFAPLRAAEVAGIVERLS